MVLSPASFRHRFDAYLLSAYLSSALRSMRCHGQAGCACRTKRLVRKSAAALYVEWAPVSLRERALYADIWDGSSWERSERRAGGARAASLRLRRLWGGELLRTECRRVSTICMSEVTGPCGTRGALLHRSCFSATFPSGEAPSPAHQGLGLRTEDRALWSTGFGGGSCNLEP